MMDPLLLLADEPTGNLDSASGLEIIALLEEFSEETVHADGVKLSRSTLIVTHDEAIASRAPRRVRLKDGQIL